MFYPLVCNTLGKQCKEIKLFETAACKGARTDSARPGVLISTAVVYAAANELIEIYFRPPRNPKAPPGVPEAVLGGSGSAPTPPAIVGALGLGHSPQAQLAVDPLAPPAALFCMDNDSPRPESGKKVKICIGCGKKSDEAGVEFATYILNNLKKHINGQPVVIECKACAGARGKVKSAETRSATKASAKRSTQSPALGPSLTAAPVPSVSPASSAPRGWIPSSPAPRSPAARALHYDMATPEGLPEPITPKVTWGVAPAPTPATRKRARPDDEMSSPVASTPGTKKLRKNQNQND